MRRPSGLSLRVRDFYTTIPEMGRGAVRRRIPDSKLAIFFESLHNAYEQAGLKPSTANQALYRPGFEEGEDLFQVGLTVDSRHRYEAGRIVALNTGGFGHAEAVIGEQHGHYSHSSGAVIEGPGDATQSFEITPVKDGSLALMTAFVIAKTEAGLFVPTEARASIIPEDIAA